MALLKIHTTGTANRLLNEVILNFMPMPADTVLAPAAGLFFFAVSASLKTSCANQFSYPAMEA